jgi:hypothetical protein
MGEEMTGSKDKEPNWRRSHIGFCYFKFKQGRNQCFQVIGEKMIFLRIVT